MPSKTIRTKEDLLRAITSLELRAQTEKLVAPLIPQLPVFGKGVNKRAKIWALQQYIREFEYNFTGTNYFNVNKDRPLNQIMDTAKTILREALPIKCLECVFVGAYLTRDLRIPKWPLRFRSVVGEQVCWHIVLAFLDQGKFGAMGLSRRDTLAWKKFEYDSMSKLVESYKAAYEELGHVLTKVTIGLPFGTDEFSQEKVHWHLLLVPLVFPSSYMPEEGEEFDYKSAYATIDEFVGKSIKLYTETKMTGTCRPNIATCRTISADKSPQGEGMQLVFRTPGSKGMKGSEKGGEKGGDDSADRRPHSVRSPTRPIVGGGRKSFLAV